MAAGASRPQPPACSRTTPDHEAVSRGSAGAPGAAFSATSRLALVSDSEKPGLDRRTFLERLLATASASAALPSLVACRRACAPTVLPSLARTFDPREWAIVEAASSRIVPTDELPGAKEANVVGFIDAQLAEPHFRVFKREFEAGVSALELVSATRFGSRFLEIKPEEQDVVLGAIQVGEGSAGDFSASHFFQVLFVLTLEGLLSDPVHGGNRDRAGWTILGYAPGPPHPKEPR